MIYKTCEVCGSDSVRVPASAVWHAANGEWIVDPHVGVDASDLEAAYCDKCNAPTSLVDMGDDDDELQDLLEVVHGQK